MYSKSALLGEATRAMKVMLTLSCVGTALDLVVWLLAPSLILFTDLYHWVADTVLEALVLVSLVLAARLSRRFPWALVTIEASLVMVATMALLALYFVMFKDYVLSAFGSEAYDAPPMWSVLAPVAGTLLTLVGYVVSYRAFRRTGLEILRVEYAHAAIDLAGGVAAVVGIALSSHYARPEYELVFTFLLMFFVFHTMLRVLEDNLRALAGKNVDAGMKERILRVLQRDLRNAVVKDVDARRYGSFYVIMVDILVPPSTSITRAHTLRKRVQRTVYGVSHLIYHVDVRFFPLRRAKG